MIPALALVLGVVLGLVLEPTVPAALQPYLPIAVVAALDAVKPTATLRTVARTIELRCRARWGRWIIEAVSGSVNVVGDGGPHQPSEAKDAPNLIIRGKTLSTAHSARAPKEQAFPVPIDFSQRDVPAGSTRDAWTPV